MNVEVSNDFTFVSNISLLDYRTFIPWKGSSEKILIDLRYQNLIIFSLIIIYLKKYDYVSIYRRHE